MEEIRELPGLLIKKREGSSERGHAGKTSFQETLDLLSRALPAKELAAILRKKVHPIEEVVLPPTTLHEKMRGGLRHSF